MRTILYIGDSYCTSLEQLREHFSPQLVNGSLVYEQLLTLHLDGLIEKWLEEGDDNEKMLAERIRQLPSGLDNTELMSRLVSIFNDQEVSIAHPPLLSFVELTYLSVDAEECLNIIDGDTRQGYRVLMKHRDTSGDYHQVDVSFHFTFRPRKTDNLRYQLELASTDNEQRRMKSKAEVSLIEQQAGKPFVVSFTLPMKEGIYPLALICEGETIAEIHVDYNAPIAIYKVGNVSFKMMMVEGGVFSMGSSEQLTPNDEKPVHQVSLSPYWIGETVVTQELWKAVMSTLPTQSFPGDKRPITDVSWNDCQQFINKLNELTGKKFRMLTEAEWEYAALGGAKSANHVYAGADEIEDVAWHEKDSMMRTQKVGKKRPNELGIYDMSGNVWEWCNDWYGNYSSEPTQNDPQGPSSGSYRVTRGGCFRSPSRMCRVKARNYCASSEKRNYIGFRLAYYAENFQKKLIENTMKSALLKRR